MCLKKRVLFAFAFIFCGLFYSQENKINQVSKISKKTQEKEKDSSYEKLLKGGVSKNGLFKVYQVNGEIYFEIPNELLGKDFLIVNQIYSVPSQVNDAGINRGINYENKLIRFYKDVKNKKIWVKTFDPKISVSKNDNIYQSVKDNYGESIVHGFDIKAFGKDSVAVIKVNEVFNGESTSFNNLYDNIGMGGAVKTKDSYIESVKDFPKNILIRASLTTQISEGKKTEEKADLTVETATNLVLLPEPMVGRFSDPRVGYFTIPKIYFSDKQQRVENKELITRWRLEPKQEDIAKYLSGQLVEPKKKILYYIDPSTPKQWQKAIIDGVKDWNKAFEKAGFKNVVSARLPDERDKDFDVDDIRYSVITYAASSLANAMGPSVVDPRTGEILDSDIIWWHNVMTLLHSWMRVQTGIIDPEVRANTFSDEKMASAIRFVSSHEVGHTFGLKHNMGASFAFPVDSLRSASFTEKMGGTAPSIMDYARYNYVAQEKDSIRQITPKIGVYDEYAINFGYRWTGEKNPKEDEKITRRWIEEHQGDPLYFYGEQQESIVDPRSQSEDLGNDAMKAGEYGLINLKKTILHVIDWTTQNGENYDEAESFYNQIINQWYVYNNHVLSNIGGVYCTPSVKGDGQVKYEPVPYNIQKRAIDFIIKNALVLPKWLFKNDLASLLKPAKNTPKGLVSQSLYGVFREKQAAILYGVMNDERLLRLLENEFLNDLSVKKMTVRELFDDLRNFIFKGTINGKNLTISERMTQKNYIDALIIDVGRFYEKTEKTIFERMPMICDYVSHFSEHQNNIGENNVSIYYDGMKRLSEVGSAKRGELIKVRNIILKYRKNGDEETKNHYEDMLQRLNRTLKSN